MGVAKEKQGWVAVKRYTGVYKLFEIEMVNEFVIEFESGSGNSSFVNVVEDYFEMDIVDEMFDNFEY
jgi:hypothetical protein